MSLRYIITNGKYPRVSYKIKRKSIHKYYYPTFIQDITKDDFINLCRHLNKENNKLVHFNYTTLNGLEEYKITSIYDYAQQNNINQLMLLSLMHLESGGTFDTYIVGDRANHKVYNRAKRKSKPKKIIELIKYISPSSNDPLSFGFTQMNIQGVLPYLFLNNIPTSFHYIDPSNKRIKVTSRIVAAEILAMVVMVKIYSRFNTNVSNETKVMRRFRKSTISGTTIESIADSIIASDDTLSINDHMVNYNFIIKTTAAGLLNNIKILETKSYINNYKSDLTLYLAMSWNAGINSYSFRENNDVHNYGNSIFARMTDMVYILENLSEGIFDSDFYTFSNNTNNIDDAPSTSMDALIEAIDDYTVSVKKYLKKYELDPKLLNIYNKEKDRYSMKE